MSIFRWGLFVLTMAPTSTCGLWVGLIALDMTDLGNTPFRASSDPVRKSPILGFEKELFPEGDLVKRHDRLCVIAASSFGLTVLTQLVIQSLSK